MSLSTLDNDAVGVVDDNGDGSFQDIAQAGDSLAKIMMDYSDDNDADYGGHAGDDDHNVAEVGDTPADTVMGRAAGVGLTVGVLRFFSSIIFIIIFQSII